VVRRLLLGKLFSLVGGGGGNLHNVLEKSSIEWLRDVEAFEKDIKGIYFCNFIY